MNKYDIKKKIKELFIVQEDDGSYNLFGSYIVKSTEQGTFLVHVTDGQYHRDVIELSSLKYAVSWCVFEKNHKHRERDKILELDETISNLNVNILIHKKLAQKRALPDKFIYLAKLYEEKLKKKQAMEEIEKYTSFSRYLQSKKYEESKDEK